MGSFFRPASIGPYSSALAKTWHYAQIVLYAVPNLVIYVFRDLILGTLRKIARQLPSQRRERAAAVAAYEARYAKDRQDTAKRVVATDKARAAAKAVWTTPLTIEWIGSGECEGVTVSNQSFGKVEIKRIGYSDVYVVADTSSHLYRSPEKNVFLTLDEAKSLALKVLAGEEVFTMLPGFGTENDFGSYWVYVNTRANSNDGYYDVRFLLSHPASGVPLSYITVKTYVGGFSLRTGTSAHEDERRREPVTDHTIDDMLNVLCTLQSSQTFAIGQRVRAKSTV